MPLLNKAVVEAYYMCAKRRIVDKKRNHNVSKELPLEYAVEMNNLIRLEMKGSIG